MVEIRMGEVTRECVVNKKRKKNEPQGKLHLLR